LVIFFLFSWPWFRPCQRLFGSSFFLSFFCLFSPSFFLPWSGRSSKVLRLLFLSCCHHKVRYFSAYR
jgi:hypothetical protein